MAPKKKSKKGYGSSGRGVATVSTPSKARIIDEPESKQTETPSSSLLEKGKSKSDVPLASENSAKTPQNPAALTPDQFERQLRDDENRLLVEKHSDHVRKEASRQATRLKTDRRVLRGQAESVNPRYWISDELLSSIWDQIDRDLREQQHGVSTPIYNPNSTIIRDDDLVRLWQLKRTLLDLDFHEDDVELALTSLVQAYRASREDQSKRSAITVLDLQRCLTWLGLNCPPDRLPDYFTYQNALKNRLLEEEEANQLQAIKEELDIPAPIERKDRSTEDADSVASEEQTESSEDECDPDDPEHLTKIYLKLMVRLHRLRPELTVVKDSKQKSKKRQQPQASLQTESFRVRKLQSQLKQLESDLLFDTDDAHLRWASQRQSIEIDNAVRQKRTFTEKEDNLAHPSIGKMEVVSGKSGLDEDGDDLLGVGDLMASLPDEDPLDAADTKVSQSSIDTKKQSEDHVRDFGKWTGLSPRRVLEEICKARDGGVKVTFRLIDQGYTKRHSVEVHWSSPQDMKLDCPTKLVSVISSRSFVRFSMTGISTPDASQSEAYISTLALFGLFSSSAKEEKSYLRLPSVWRNLYSELRESSRAMQLDTDTIELDAIRTLAESETTTLQYDPSLKPDPQANSVASGGKESQNGQSGRPSLNSDVEAVRQIWASKSASDAFRKMEHARKVLPMWSFKSQLLLAIENSQIVIVCGETGCGKSTQTPSFILEHELSLGRDCRIYCTEPRRISAISLARRVSEELGEGRSDLGTKKSLVGYSIRLESKISSETRLVYATTGVVMRLLERDADLTEVTHLILDEVHERTIDSDFLLIILRRLTVRRPNLKVILMSATVDAERFSKYLHGAPVFNVPGRTFPVSVNFLEDAIEVVGPREAGSKVNGGAETSTVDDLSEVEEDGYSDHGTGQMAADDLSAYSVATRNALKEYNEYRINYDLIVRLLDAIYTKREYEEYSKATLVFLPGINEIRRLNDMLSGHARFSKRCQVFSLHSTIAMEEQERAFQVPPPGVRKIVLATNIAETGITIPDITCVIDSGTHKEMRFDERRQLSRLIEAFISRANAKQRRGRAGRVQNGLCFHLFTRARHDRLMAEQQTPEMMRLSLQDLVLRIKICHLGDIEKTLLEALDAPLAKNVRRAVDYLIDVKALTQGEQLTLLGRQLAKLPLDVFLGKLILLGSVFKCLDSCLSFAAILSSKSPFAAPMAARTLADHAKLSFKKGDSDLLTIYNAYSSWRRVCKSQGASEVDFCRRNYLSSQTLANIEEVKGQLAGALVDAGFLRRDEKLSASLSRVKSHSRQRHFVELPAQVTLNDSRETVIDSVIAWAFYPKLMQRDGKGWRNVTSNQPIALHPSSVNKRDFTGRFMSFYHLMQSASKAYNAHETSAVDDFAIALACGDADFQLYAGVVSLDSNRVRFAMPSWKSMLALKYLRSNMLEILEDVYKKPSRQLSDRQQRWFDLLQKCFEHRCDAN